MDKFSQENIVQNCPHCDPHSFALKHPLYETKNFWIVCDVHPLCRGHILIIPKKHLSSIGEYPKEIYQEFVPIYQKVSRFVKLTYESVATFEHGKIGQTVFHSHVHLLPFGGKINQIIPEGKSYLLPLKSLDDLFPIYKSQDKYLFVSIGDQMWSVNVALGQPRFFRDRFAIALGVPERGNWKTMHDNSVLMAKANQEISQTEQNWKLFNT